MKTVLLTVLSIFLFAIRLIAQPKTIHLKNPSFEDYPRAERVPEGWRDCGFPGETAADTHPSGAFDVVKYAADGETYLGMVTRDNDTWEQVGQKLAIPMMAGQDYIFKIDLCQSPVYTSSSRLTKSPAKYTKPIRLRIWGGNDFCKKAELLVTSELINHSEWGAYIFDFYPKMNYAYIILEAFYNAPILFPYNGNVLIDNASPIIPIPHDSVAVWTIDKKASILLGTERIFVKINEEDIDKTARNTATVYAPRNESTLPLPLIPAIYYNSTLTATEKEVVLNSIIEFIKNNPSAKANIIIQEPTRKEQKIQRKLLVEKLKKMGIPKQKYYISLFKK